MPRHHRRAHRQVPPCVFFMVLLSISGVASDSEQTLLPLAIVTCPLGNHRCAHSNVPFEAGPWRLCCSYDTESGTHYHAGQCGSCMFSQPQIHFLVCGPRAQTPLVSLCVSQFVDCVPSDCGTDRCARSQFRALRSLTNSLLPLVTAPKVKRTTRAGSAVGFESAALVNRYQSRPDLFPSVFKTGVLTATCEMKLDHGVVAVGHGTVSVMAPKVAQFIERCNYRSDSPWSEQSHIW